jgi:hypothetical protein
VTCDDFARFDDDYDEDCGLGRNFDDFENAPDFGCACENPLVVDTVCEGCIEWLKEQEAATP